MIPKEFVEFKMLKRKKKLFFCLSYKRISTASINKRLPDKLKFYNTFIPKTFCSIFPKNCLALF